MQKYLEQTTRALKKKPSSFKKSLSGKKAIIIVYLVWRNMYIVFVSIELFMHNM